MPRFRSYVRTKKIGALNSSAAQTITETLKRVNGRRLAAVQIQLVITNGATAPTYQSGYDVTGLISEIRVKASDYAGGSQRAVRRLSGFDAVAWEREMELAPDRDLAGLILQSGANSGVYAPSFFVHLSHPGLDETVRHRTALPLNAPSSLGQGEGIAFVSEEPVIEVDVPDLDTVYSANLPSVDVIAIFHEVEMDLAEPYVADELVSSDFTWSGSGRATAYEFAQNGWLLDTLMQWKVSGTRSDAILSTTSDFFSFTLGKVDQEAWTVRSLRAFNERGRYTAPSVIASATTLPSVNNPAGVVMRDFLFNTPNSGGWNPIAVPSLYSANAGDRVMIQPTNLVASTTTRFTNHRAFISDITKLTRV